MENTHQKPSENTSVICLFQVHHVVTGRWTLTLQRWMGHHYRTRHKTIKKTVWLFCPSSWRIYQLHQSFHQLGIVGIQMRKLHPFWLHLISIKNGNCESYESGLPVGPCCCTAATKCVIAKMATAGRSEKMAKQFERIIWNWKFRDLSVFMDPMYIQQYCPHFTVDVTGYCRILT